MFDRGVSVKRSLVLSLMVGCLGWVVPVSQAALEPSVAHVPWAEHAIQIDGHVNADEWQDAAVLQLEQSTDDKALSSTIAGKQTHAVQATVAYLKHDGQSLWVAFTCEENQQDYPQAFPRGPQGNLEWDDCVQVVLGTADHAVIQREILDVGGYKDAMNAKAAKADHYYHFTVNAAGSRSRTYNEFPLSTPSFESKTATGNGKWSVEMRIDLSSAGIKKSSKEPIFLNLFRVRPPERIGWHSPAYGGYRAIKLGDLVLLGKGQSDQRSQEEPSSNILSNISIKLPLKMKLGYYPLAGSVVGTVIQSPPYVTGKAELLVTGVDTQTVTLRSVGQQSVVVKLPLGDQPARNAIFKLHEDNQPVREVTRELNAVKVPQWAGTKAGMEYAHQKIPAPWSQPVIHEQTVKLLDKQVHFGHFGLMDSIVHQGQQMLQGSAEVQIHIKGQPLTLKPTSPVVTRDGHALRVVAQAGDDKVRLLTQAKMDYDGFTVVKMRLDGVDARDISKFVLRIPLTKQTGTYLHRLLVQHSAKLDGYGFSGEKGPMWCGNEDRGLSFNFDTDLFFSKDRRQQIRIVEQADRVWMEFQFVDGPDQVPDKDTVFRFFLQPTPTKPIPMQKNHPRTLQYKWEMWTRYQGYPDLSKIPEIKKWSKTMLDDQRIPMLYTCQGLQEDSPDFKTFADDLKTKPDWIFYRRHHNPGKGVPSYACCKRGPEGDLQLWGMKQLVDQAGISGVLSDGLSIAWGCENPAHDACRLGQPVSWENDMPSRVVSQRTFLKRYRGLFDQMGKPFFMSAHTGGGLDINTLSFFDGYLEGEQLGRFPNDYQIPPDVYTIGYSGIPWGLKTEFWIKRWRRSKGDFWALSYALLHDNELRGSRLVNELLKGFDDHPDTTFYPYWRTGKHISLQSENGHSRMSYYLRKDAGLVIVSNLSYQPDQVTLDMRKFIKSSHAVELISNERIKITDGKLKLQLMPFKCVALRLSNTTAEPAIQDHWQTTGSLDDWRWVGGKGGVKKTNTSGPGDQPAVTLSSTINASQAQLQFAKSFKNQSGHVRFMMTHQDRLMIKFGKNILIKYYMGWSEHGFKDGVGQIMQPKAITNGRFVPVEISLNQGVIDMTYNNQPLVVGMQLPEQSESTVTLCTWGGNQMSVLPQESGNKAIALYAGGAGEKYVKHVPPAVDFDQEMIPANSWTVNDQGRGVSSKTVDWQGQEFLELHSIAGQSLALASLSHLPIGRNATITMKIQFGKRTQINLGPIRMIWDGSWRVQGPKNGWGQGWIYNISKVSTDQPSIMMLSLRDGVMDVTLNGQVFVRDMAFELPDGGNILSVGTWAGYSLRVAAMHVSSHPTELLSPEQVKHPALISGEQP